MTTPIPRVPAEIEAHLAHLAEDLVLQHRLAQRLTHGTVEALLAISRRDPGIDQGGARLLVQQALTAIVTAEILTLREGRP